MTYPRDTLSEARRRIEDLGWTPAERQPGKMLVGQEVSTTCQMGVLLRISGAVGWSLLLANCSSSLRAYSMLLKITHPMGRLDNDETGDILIPDFQTWCKRT